MYDLAQSPGALDWDKLQAFMAHHSSGVHTLIAPRRPDQASAVGAELLREIYSILRQNYDWVIVDTPPGFTAEVITSIDHSTDIVMVGMLDSLSLKNTKLGLETLELMKYDTDHIYLLLNRAHSRVGISQSDVEAVLGRTPDVFIPSDREIPRTVNEGIPIVVARPQSEPAEAFGRLTDLLMGESVSTAQPSRDGRRSRTTPLLLRPPRAVGSSDERARPWNSTSESRTSAAPSESRSRSPSSRTAST